LEKYSEICTRYWSSNKIGFKRIKMTQKMKIPSPLVSILPVAVLVILLFFTIRLFGADALGGGSQICLLLTTALCAALGMSRYGVSWKDIEHAIINNIAGVSSALIILLIIGALSAAWMLLIMACSISFQLNPYRLIPKAAHKAVVSNKQIWLPPPSASAPKRRIVKKSNITKTATGSRDTSGEGIFIFCVILSV
jgi:hypothetical protein